MKNKKGFTLIELLAVIIILGVLMATAVVGVTRYIQDSRKSTYANTAGSYIQAITTAANADKVATNQVNTLYLVPVGTDDTKACSKLEKGGVSPFHKTWTYAYVGVVYDNASRKYFYVSLDGANHAINFATSAELQDKGGKLIVTGEDVTNIAELSPNYGTSRKFFVGTGTSTDPNAVPGSAELRAMAAAAGTDAGTTINYVEFIARADCDV